MLISKFSNCNVEGEIVDIERQYHIVLPLQYKSFLHKIVDLLKNYQN